MVSIIIPVSNQLDFLQNCLISIKENTSLNYEVIISDNGSNESAIYFYNECLKQGLIHKVLYNKSMVGFSKAINQATYLIAPESTHVLWLNSDTVIKTNRFLEKLLSSDADLTGPISNAASFQTFLPQISINQEIPKYKKMKSFKCFLLNGFCVLIKRNVFENLKLDEKFFPHYGSEDDYNIQAYKKGFSLKVNPNVFIHHFGRTTYKDSRKPLVMKATKGLNEKYGQEFLSAIVFKNDLIMNEKRKNLIDTLLRTGEIIV